jgi:hypothetical protein
MNSQQVKATIKVYEIDNKEIHLMGEYVAVVYNLETRKETKSFEKDGLTYTANLQTKVRKGDPYIDFVNIKEDNDGSFWDDEDITVGNMDIECARDVANELLLAAEYLEKLLEKENE